MATPLTSATPYCTGGQFVGFFDARTAGQLLSDSDIPIAPARVPADPTLALFLLAASGKIETAAVRGTRYTPADLQAIVTGGGAMAMFLAKLTAGIAMAEIVQRRPDVAVPPMPQLQEAEEFLQALVAGDRIFSTVEVAAAGLEETQQEQPRDVASRRLNTRIAQDYFGRRGNQYPTPA